MNEAQQLLEAALAGELDMDAQPTEGVQDEAGTQARQDEPQQTEQAEQADSEKQAEPDNGKAEQAPEGGAATDAGQDEENETPGPIASKSGHYTIEYQKLVDARAQRDQYKAQAQQLSEALAALQTQQQAQVAEATPVQKAAEVQPQADQGPVFEDFSEEGLAKGVQKLVQMQLAQSLTPQVQQAVQQAVQPLAQQQQQMTQQQMKQAHLDAIYAVHADAHEVAESQEFQQWVQAQPGYAQAAIAQVLQTGSAQEVVEVLSGFKQAQAASVDTQAAKAAAATAPAKPLPKAGKQGADAPVSLSELPGAAPASGGSDVQRAMDLAQNPAALLEFMAQLSPEKQAKLMNSVV